MALAVLVAELVWAASFFGRLLFRLRVSDLAAYMFRGDMPLHVRALSLAFHVVMPCVLVWMLHRLVRRTRASGTDSACMLCCR